MVVSSRSKTLVAVAEKLDSSLQEDEKFPCKFHDKITESELEKIFYITRENMQLYYDACNDETWKWNDLKKLNELQSIKNRFIIHTIEGQICGFLAFRFMVECGDPVAYIWEIQVESESAGKGIGSQMMSKLESFLREKTAIRKIVLTVLKNNERAIKFYQNRGYTEDKSSPQSACYRILSRTI
jgi:ribosomal protein S18 acetylase RimI-like enzyme